MLPTCPACKWHGEMVFSFQGHTPPVPEIRCPKCQHSQELALWPVQHWLDLVVHHVNGNPYDNSMDNLRLVDPKENVKR
jgi:hypothetical protein